MISVDKPCVQFVQSVLCLCIASVTMNGTSTRQTWPHLRVTILCCIQSRREMHADAKDSYSTPRRMGHVVDHLS